MQKMPKIFMGLLVAAVVMMAGGDLIQRAMAPDQEIIDAYRIHKEIESCTVRIEIGQGGGSGTVIRQADKAVILTAFHVVKNAKSLTVSYTDGMTGERKATAGKVVKTDEKNDLALVETDPIWPGVASVITDKQYRQDFAIFMRCLISGYPMSVHTTHVTAGLICDLNDRDMMRTSAPAIFGNSGGGVFVKIDKRWRLVGVCLSVRTLDGQRVHPLPHINFSAMPTTVLEFIRQ